MQSAEDDLSEISSLWANQVGSPIPQYPGTHLQVPRTSIEWLTPRPMIPKVQGADEELVLASPPPVGYTTQNPSADDWEDPAQVSRHFSC